MNILLLFFALQILCLAAGFGVAYSILKNTSYRHLSVVLAPVLFPAFLVLFETLCGHRIPAFLPAVVPLLITLLLAGYSAVVIWRERSGLAVIRWDLLRAGGMLLAATVLGLTWLGPDLAHGSLTFVDIFFNNELLNYAALAQHLMGKTVHQAYAGEYAQYIMSRSGAELLLASLSYTVQAPPANCLYLLISLLRAHAVAAFGFLLLRATNCGITKRPALLYSGLVLFAVFPLELLIYSASFLSQFGVAPLVIVAVALLIREEDITNLRVLGLLSLLYLCVIVSYPEIVPVLGFIQGGQALLLGVRRRSTRLFLFAVSPFAVAFLLNPALALERFRFLRMIAGVQAGGVMFVPPHDSIIGYGASILGLRFWIYGIKAFGSTWTEGVIVSALLIYAAAALYLVFRRGNQNWAACAALLLIVCTVVLWFTNPAKDGPGTVYRAEKAIVYGHFLFIAALVIAVAELPERTAWRYTVAAMYAILFIAAFRVGAEGIGRFSSWRKAYPLADVRRAIKAFPNGVPVALPEGNGNASMYWNDVLQYFGIVERYVEPQTRKQSPALFDGRADPALWPAASRQQTGIIIADKFRTSLESDGIMTVAAVNSRPDKLLYRSDSFIVYPGRLSQNVTDFSAVLRVRVHDLRAVKVPLLTTGGQFKGSIVYLNPDTPGHYRLELDVWNKAHKIGVELATDPSAANEDDVVLLEGKGTEAAYSISATVNGRMALEYQGPFDGASVLTMFWGKNPIFFPGVAAVCETCSIGQVRLNDGIQQ